jgi:type I restriction enzyme, S subunit
LKKEKLTALIEDMTSGGRPKGGASNTTGVPSIGAEHITSGGKFNFSKVKFVPIDYYQSMSKGKVTQGDILLVKDGATTGRVSIVDETFPFAQASINEHLFQLKVKRDRLSPKYCFFYLTSLTGQNEILSDFRGATVGGISRKFTDYVQVPLPDLPTQQRIVQILDEADALRQADTALLEKYEELLQSVFFDLFGKTEEMKKKYPLQKLHQVAAVVSGVAKNTKAYKDNFIEVPYMRVANVQDGHINLSEIKTIKVSRQDFEKYLLQPNDILLTEGGDPDKLGRGAVWHDEISPCIHQNHIFRVRPNQQLINASYLSHHIGSTYGKMYFLKAAKQTTGIASINMTQLKDFYVIVPPIRLQNHFAEIVTGINEQKQLVKAQQQQSEALFQSLLQRAFNGKL